MTDDSSVSYRKKKPGTFVLFGEIAARDVFWSNLAPVVCVVSLNCTYVFHFIPLKKKTFLAL